MPARQSGGSRHGIARVISKNGMCSRAEAERRVRAGRVMFGNRIVHDPEMPVFAADAPLVRVDGIALGSAPRIYIALNKPRGLVTTTNDEKGRRTVYECFAASDLPWIAPVGRLDQASEGLLLFTNDSQWAANVTGPHSCIEKSYHVQVRGQVTAEALTRMVSGVPVESDLWCVKSAKVLREGNRTTWLSIVLDEGKNRQIRRILETLNLPVMRLVRVAIGSVALNELAKGTWRYLDEAQIHELAG